MILHSPPSRKYLYGLLGMIICVVKSITVSAETQEFNYFTSVYLPDGICVDDSGNVFVTSVNPNDVFEEYLTKFSSEASLRKQIPMENTGRLEYDPYLGKIWMLAGHQFYLIDPTNLAVQPSINIEDITINTDQIYDIATGSTFTMSIDPSNAFYGDFALYYTDDTLQMFVAGFYQAWHFILRIPFSDQTVQNPAIIVTSGATLSPNDNSPHGVAVNSNGVVFTTLGKAGMAANVDQPVAFRADYPQNGNQPPVYLFDEYQTFSSRGMAVDQQDNFYVATGWVGGGTVGSGNSCIIMLPSALDTAYAYPMESLYANPRDVCIDQQHGLAYYTDSDVDFFTDYDAVWTMSITTKVQHEQNIGIQQSTLEQNYPNPFNASTTIRYRITEQSYVTVTIYDILGRKINALINRSQSPGLYSIRWDASRVNSGIYWCKLHAKPVSKNSSYSRVIKLAVIR